MRMERLVAAALVGVARHSGSLDTATGAPVDALTAALPADEPERALLLRAGVAAIYRQAGRVAQCDVESPALAPAESRPVCSPGAAALFKRLFKEGNVVLPEAVERLNRAGLRLPFELLPEALATQDDDVRLQLAPALGERGRWLSHFVAAWNWVDGALIQAAGALPPGADTIWEEGALTARVALLRQARAVDPERARAWVTAVWKQEKAETREELIGCYGANLAADDEPFLEAALDDRAGGVRTIAASLLARLPGSAFATRARERADAMLAYVDGKLIVTLPTNSKPEWARDGMTPEPSKSNQKGDGPRATWLTEAIALVIPTPWQQRFGLSPEELIAAAEQTEWSEALADAWIQAALAHQATAWMLPLWRWRHQGRVKGARYNAWTGELTSNLFAGVLADTRRDMALDALTCGPVTNASENASEVLNRRQWLEAVVGAPAPWDEEFSATYLAGLRAFVPQITPELLNSKTSNPFSTWLATLQAAQTALASTSIAVALAPLRLPTQPVGKFDWQSSNAQSKLDDFTNILQLRQRVQEEIPG